MNTVEPVAAGWLLITATLVGIALIGLERLERGELRCQQ